MRAESRLVRRCTVQIERRVYASPALAEYGGLRCLFRWSPLAPQSVILVGPAGGPELPEMLRIPEQVGIPVDADPETLATAMEALNAVRREERRRVREMVGAAESDENPMAAQARRIREANAQRRAASKRGQVAAGAGLDPVEMVQAKRIRDVDPAAKSLEKAEGRKWKLYADELEAM